MPCGDGGMAVGAHFDPVLPPGRNAAHDLGADRRRLLAARIVVGHQGEVGQPRGDLAHHRPLAAIAIAAAAEHHDQLAAGRTAAASPAPSPAPRACGRNRHRPGRPICGAPRAAGGPARRSSVASAGDRRAPDRRPSPRRGRVPPAHWRPGSRRPAAARSRAAWPSTSIDQMLAGGCRLVAQQAEFAALGAVGPEAHATARQISASAAARSLSALTTAVPPAGSSSSNRRALAAK